MNKNTRRADQCRLMEWDGSRAHQCVLPIGHPGDHQDHKGEKVAR